MTRGDVLLAKPFYIPSQNVFIKAVYEAAARGRQRQSSLPRSTPIKLDDMSPAAPGGLF